MIKFTAEGSKGKILGIGLSRLNCEKLLTGQPITLDTKSLGLPFQLQIIIIGGESEFAITDELERNGMMMPEDPDNIHIDGKLGG